MPPLITLWIWLCAYLNCAGWALSALHELNARGYAIAFILGAAAVFFWRKNHPARFPRKSSGKKLSRRFKKIFPLAFLVLASLAFLGGALHAPANYDGLAYRTPRVLNWLAENQWHWIHTEFSRLNTRSAGFEWITAPLFLFTGTDRLEFLINIICFLLLPGRVFALLIRLGVRPRAAWHWMWLLPSGYGYVLQAGSSVNDLFGALMALTAVEFALRAGAQGKFSDVWTSSLAAALMTSAKAFNIVLLLPWAIAILPALKILPRRPLATLLLIVFAGGASLIPNSWLNQKNCGDWTGLKIEQPMIGGGGKLPRFFANAVNIPLANLAPPLFPFASRWSHFVETHLPSRLAAALNGSMEKGLAKFEIPEMQLEESSGLGCGVALLLLALLLKKISAGEFLARPLCSLETFVALGGWASLGVLMMQSGAAGPARYLLPFYILLLAPLLAGHVAGNIFSRCGWRLAALLVFASAAALVVFSPARPLWPANSILLPLAEKHPGNKSIQRAAAVYSVYSRRPFGFAPVIAALPPGASPLGFFAFDEPEGSLWKPFGARRILHICRDDLPAQVKARGINYALVSERFLAQHQQMKPAEWLAQMNAVLVQRFELKLLAGQEPRSWMLVKFQ